MKQPEHVIPIINEIDEYTPVGLFPYEMTWVQRSDEPLPLVDFEDMKGWNLETYKGANGKLYRSREQQLWGQHVAKLTYSGKSENSFLILLPPKPLSIPEPFDCIHIWIFGNTLKRDMPEIAVILQDADGHEYKIPLLKDTMGWRQWFFVHKRVPKEILASIKGHCCFLGLEVSGIFNKQPRSIYLDSLAFYKEKFKPLHFNAQPKRNLKPWREQIVGTNTGEGTLPFPTREETILPANYERVFTTTVSKIKSNHYIFKYKGTDAQILYEYIPLTGSLGEITVNVNNHHNFKLMEGGGVRFANGRIPAGRLIESNLIKNVVRTKFEVNEHIVEYALQLWQKSLVLDVLCDDGKASELLFGKITGVENPQLVYIPYITYGWNYGNPAILMSGSPKKPIFASIWWDWYRTNASEPFVKPHIKGKTAEIQGGVRYIPKTNGERNNMYERIFLTVSPIYEEVLPSIPNPLAIRGKESADRLWTVTMPESWRDDHIRCRKISSYGINKIMQHSHEFTWRDEGESFTLRLKASPQKGGDAMLKWYNKAQQSLGWLQGMYTNYSDYAPVNVYFSEDDANRSPDGELRRTWRRCYAMKCSKGVEWDAKLAKKIQRKFNSNFAYTDVLTASSPWRRCDYDPRVPGAGTLTAMFYAHGQILLNDQKVYGPTFSEGTYQWMYAGLATGNYGWAYTNLNLLEEPLNVAFDLLKIHPLENDYGMGNHEYYLQRLDPNWLQSDKLDWYIDRFLASTIAYGHNGWLIAYLEKPEIMARSYYMMQQLQKRYSMVPVLKIEYADLSGKMRLASQALAISVIRESRLHVVYENGLEVFVNGNGSSKASNKNWCFTAPDGIQVELPPAGWYVYDASTNFKEFSGLISNKRIDYVISPEYEFLDGRGQWTKMGNLAASGAVAMRSQRDRLLEFIDIYGNKRIGFKTTTKSGHMKAYDEEGNVLGEVPIKLVDSGYYEFCPVLKGRKYLYFITDN